MRAETHRSHGRRGEGIVDMYYIELIHSNPRLQRAKDMDQD